MASKVGRIIANFVIQRDGACRACGLPATLRGLLDVDHISVSDKVRYMDRPSDCPAAKLQCLCRYCNNVKGSIDVPPLPIRRAEYNIHQIALNQEHFSNWVDEHRPPSTRRMARLAKRK
jgi:hypothetical protein